MPDTDRTATNSAPVDLTNCDREPIHILGHVQDYGCLVAVSTDWIVCHVSTNTGEMLGFTPDDALGTPLSSHLDAEFIQRLRSRLQLLTMGDTSARLFQADVCGDGRLFDVSVHASGRSYVIEFEPAAENSERDHNSIVQSIIMRLRKQDTLEGAAQEAARGVRLVTGFDRVMIYRFLDDASGQVIAESVRDGTASYMNLRFPASDIPKQARALYARSPIRIISDVEAPRHEIVPPLSPSGEPLDLSLSVTRAVSPIHLEYLRNMGVGASLSISIMRKGKLWGLVACHHFSPRHVDFERRSALELFAQLFSYELAQIETEREIEDVDKARRLHDVLMNQMSSGQGLASEFDTLAEHVRDAIPFDGIVHYSEGVYTARGSVPAEDEFHGLVRFLNTATASQVFSTDNIVARYPAAETFAERAAGLMALPVSRTPRDYIVLFRREITQTVNWAGNPEKPVDLGPNGIRLTPRKSFDTWREVVRGQSRPWTEAEQRAAESLRVTLIEVILKLTDEAEAERKQAAEQQELLIAELNHRVRNILNLIRGLVSQSRGSAVSVDEYTSVLDTRITALARAHDQLTEQEWGWTPLRNLIETEAQAYLAGRSDRVKIVGDRVELAPSAFTTLALVVHELMTNSAKYGALSDSTGSITIRKTLERDGTLVIEWTEAGGPPVQAPTRKGFGTTIIQRSIPFDLRGTAEVHYKMTGLQARFTVPSSLVRPLAGAPRTNAAPTVEAKPVNLDGEAMVLEDNMIIALDVADMLEDMGARSVHIAANVADALKHIAEGALSFAILDVNLGNETSLAAAEALSAKGIPFVLATGYGASKAILESFPSAPVVKKPYTQADLQGMLGQM